MQLMPIQPIRVLMQHSLRSHAYPALHLVFLWVNRWIDCQLAHIDELIPLPHPQGSVQTTRVQSRSDRYLVTLWMRVGNELRF